MADQTLDCKGMNCPMPIIMLSKAIKPLNSGQTVEVLATDPAFKPDLEAWAKRLGHAIVSFDTGDGGMSAVVQKK